MNLLRPFTFVRCALLLSLLHINPGLAVDLDRHIDVDIPAGTSLEQALLDVMSKADTPLNFASSSVAHYRAPRLEGNYTLSKALVILLQDTKLCYRVASDAIYVIRNSDATFAFRESPCSRHKSQVTKSGPASKHDEPPDSTSSDSGEQSTVVVTGTHLFDNVPQLPVHFLTQSDFTRAGFQTVGDAIRSVVQSFGGGLNPAVVSARGNDNTGSLSGASSANLHGLGSSSTLLLVNGHRIATSEGSGAVDVTLVPISAVERIEIISGDASAVYGSDAVAGVVNIILREHFEGQEFSGTLGRAIDGGGLLQRYDLIAGGDWNDGNAVVVFDCARQREIDSSQRPFIPSDIAGTTLVPHSHYCSSVLNVRQSFSQNITASMVGLYTTRDTSASENLQALQPGVTASTQSNSTQYAFIAALRAHLVDDWTGELVSTVSEDNVNSPERLLYNAVSYEEDGNRFDNSLRSMEFNLGGTLVQLPAGPVSLAAGAGYDEEGFLFTNTNAGVLSTVERRRNIGFLFGETLVPLLHLRKAQDFSVLSLRVAGRASWYGDFGATFNPKIGIFCRPLRSLSLQASWGTSYRAPTLLQRYNIQQAFLEFLPDSTSPDGKSLALFDFGGNAHLRPEKSSGLTVDLMFTPSVLPDSAFELTWYDIDDRQRIAFPTANTGDPLSDSSVWPFVVRDPSSTLIAQTLAQSQFVDLTGGKYLPGQATIVIDDRTQNITRRRASGIDLATKYGRELALGRLDGSINLAYLDLREQVVPMSPTTRLSGTAFYPPNLRSRIGLDWTGSSYGASLFVNYIGTSRDTATFPQRSVGSWATLDGSIGYVFPATKQWSYAQLTLSAQNMLGRRPPAVNTVQPGPPNVGFDSTNTSAAGRSVILRGTIGI